MENPKKMQLLHKDSNFLIRKTLRPPSALRATRFKDFSEKKLRDGRKSVAECYNINRSVGPSTLGLSTTCWCLFDSRNNKEYGFRQNYQRQVASLTKIMTTILTIELTDKWNINQTLLIRITDTASKMIGTTANLKAGTWLTLKDLLYGAMLPSGNDAAYTLAEVIGYFLVAEQKYSSTSHFSSVQKINLTNENTANYVTEFLRMMNIKADELMLIQTRFSNPHGLQNAMNISSAKDILALSIYASKNAIFRKVMNSEVKRYEYYSDEYKSQKEIKRWYNTNNLLARGWEGIKTGQTITAGCCLSSLKHGVYIVVLNCCDIDRRFIDTQKLFNWYIQSQEKEVLILPSLDSPEKLFQS